MNEESHLGKCSNRKVRTSTLVNDGTLKSTVNFPSAQSNVNNVKISDLLDFLEMFLFCSLCSHQKVSCRKLQDFENIHGGDSFWIT